MTTKKAIRTALTAHEKALLAGLFARTNMGMEHPKLAEVLPLRERSPRMNREPHYADFVMMFCEQFMESDTHIDVFEKEAKMWWKTLSKKTMSREYILKVWPAHHWLLWSQPYYLLSTIQFATEGKAIERQKDYRLSRRYKLGDKWFVDTLSRNPVEVAQKRYLAGYPNAGSKRVHDAGLVL